MVCQGDHLAKRRSPAFSLVELVVVVTIIGIIAAIAVPRMSNATTSASASALQASVTNVRKAIDCYYAEHSSYPGYVPGTNTPNGDRFIDQLLLYSNRSGETSSSYGHPFIYGPYLRPPFPVNPTNELDTVEVKATPGVADPAEGSVGWVAVLSHGYFGISASDADLDDVGVIDIIKKDLVRGATLAE